jgi:mRNA interferase MazF
MINDLRVVNKSLKADWKSWCPRRGEIFLVGLGDSNSLIDSELRGLRPALVISNDINNKFSPTIQIAPLTSSQCKANIPVHIKVGIEDGLRTESLVCLEQAKVISKRRGWIGNKLIKITHLSEKKMKEIDTGLKIQFGLD